MKKIFFILSALLLTTTVSSQALDGTWNGKLKVGGNSLTVVLNIDGNSCTLDSPDQGAKGIAAELLTKTEDSLSIRVPSIYASYEGKLQNDTLKGIFQQMGQRFPLTLTRGQHVVKRPQTPQPPFPYLTEEVTFSNESDGAVLSGTLTYPVGYTKKQRPTVVVMVSGSGLQNRDEEIFEHKPFAVIADYFARNGIATLRYDDRGFGKSTGDVATATTKTFKSDAEAALRFLRDSKRFGKAGIIGHSEGGSVAFMLAGEKKADFIVTLAAPGVRGDSIIIQQNYDLAKNTGQPVTYEQCVALMPNIRQQMAQNAWYMWFLDYDPAADIARIACPTLILNGEKDLQVDAAINLQAIRSKMSKSPIGSTQHQKTGNFQIISYPNLNHLFQNSTTGLPSEYGQIEETFSEKVMKDMVEWITKHIE